MWQTSGQSQPVAAENNKQNVVSQSAIYTVTLRQHSQRYTQWEHSQRDSMDLQVLNHWRNYKMDSAWNPRIKLNNQRKATNKVAQWLVTTIQQRTTFTQCILICNKPNLSAIRKETTTSSASDRMSDLHNLTIVYTYKTNMKQLINRHACMHACMQGGG